MPTEGPGFLMHGDDSGYTQMFHVGIPEEPIIQWARQFGDKSKVFIDCGAHMGAYSTMLADEFKEVYAFEAQSRTFMQLCGNIFINEKSNIHPIHAAVTSHDKHNLPLTLSIVSEDGGGSTLYEPDKEVLATEQVIGCTLDSFALENVGLIKLDIEGGELEALEGSKYTIKKNYPALIFEMNDKPALESKNKELLNYIRNFGYEVAQIKPFDNMYYGAINIS